MKHEAGGDPQRRYLTLCSDALFCADAVGVWPAVAWPFTASRSRRIGREDFSGENGGQGSSEESVGHGEVSSGGRLAVVWAKGRFNCAGSAFCLHRSTFEAV